MAYKSLSDIVQDVIIAISQVPGTSVQIYAEDRVAQFVQDAFDIAFKKHFWDEYTQWYTSALDGTTGLLTDTTFIAEIIDPQDIDKVYREDSDRPLAKFPTTNRNRVRFEANGGTGARFYDTNPNSHTVEGNASVIKVFPITATDNINVRARREPTKFVATDIIRIDHLYLRFLAAWFYLSDDGANPDATDRLELLAEDRFLVITSNEDDDVIDLNGNIDTVLNGWTC